MGTLRRSRLAGWAASLVFAIVPIASWLTRGTQPSRSWGGPWVWAAFGVAALVYHRAISVRRALVKLDGATVVAGGQTFSRAGLTVERRRWIETTYGYGTTEGTALVLTEGSHRVAIGCKGSGPDGDLPTTGDVRIVLSASDLRELSAALRSGASPLGHHDGGHALTVHVAPSLAGPRRQWSMFVPFLAAVAMASLVGAFARDLGLREESWSNQIWMPVVLVIGMALSAFFSFRTPVANLLVVEPGQVTYRDGRTGKTFASCPLHELGVHRARHLGGGRFVRFESPVITLRWPAGRTLVLGPAGWRGPVDPRLPRRFFAPSYLVGEGEWDALGRALGR